MVCSIPVLLGFPIFRFRETQLGNQIDNVDDGNSRHFFFYCILMTTFQLIVKGDEAGRSHSYSKDQTIQQAARRIKRRKIFGVIQRIMYLTGMFKVLFLL